MRRKLVLQYPKRKIQDREEAYDPGHRAQRNPLQTRHGKESNQWEEKRCTQREHRPFRIDLSSHAGKGATNQQKAAGDQPAVENFQSCG